LMGNWEGYSIKDSVREISGKLPGVGGVAMDAPFKWVDMPCLSQHSHRSL